MLEERCQFAGRGIVEWEHRCADGACAVADEPARGLDGNGVALVFEELAERPEPGPLLTGRGEVDARLPSARPLVVEAVA
jgi:hypothetical protein